MKFLSFLVFTFIISATAHASYLESCEFRAKVVAKSNLAIVDNQSHTGSGPLVTVVEIVDTKDLGSHHPRACESRKNQIQAIQLENDVAYELEEGSIVTLGYFFVSNQSPRGITSFSRWNLIK